MIGKQVKKLRMKRSLSQRELAEKIGQGLTQQHIYNLEKSSAGFPAYLKELIVELDTSYEELVLGDEASERGGLSGSLDPVQLIDNLASIEALPVGGFIMINVLDEERLTKGNGGDSVPVTDSPEVHRSDWVRNADARSTRLLTQNVRDNKMKPVLFLGDSALIDLSQNKIENGNVYSFTKNDGYALIRRLFLVGDGVVHAIMEDASDPAHAYPTIFQEADIEIIGRVISRSGSGGL